MPFAQGSRSSLSYVVENSFGVTPSSPAMKALPFTSHSLNLSKERVQGNDIQSDRMPRVDRHGTRQAGGDISFDLRETDYDDFLESAFFSSFDTSGVMKIGTSPKYLTIEDAANDISQFKQMTGMAVSSLSFSIAPNQMVQCTATMVGKDQELAQSSLGSPSASSGNNPFDSFSGSINEGGSSIAIVSSLDFSISNSLSPTFTVGNETTTQLEYGRAVIEGSLVAYFEDNSLIDKFIDETESSLEVTVDDPTSGGAYTFLMPRVKYNGGDVPVSDPQSRLITLPFVALYDSGEDTNLKLTKA